MQQDLRILGVVLIPGVIAGIACPGHSQRGNQAQFKSALMQKVGERPVLGARGFKSNADRCLKRPAGAVAACRHHADSSPIAYHLAPLYKLARTSIQVHATRAPPHTPLP